MPIVSLPYKLRKTIYEQLRDGKLIDNVVAYGDIMGILSSIWGVYSMPLVMNDNRYKNYGEEIVQHYVMNNDVKTDELFLSQLQVLDNEDKFKNFVIQILNANNKEDVGIQAIINGILIDLHKQNIDILSIIKKGEPVFTEFSRYNNSYQDIEANTLPIFVISACGHTHNPNSQRKPETYPSFQLIFDSGWNDYSYKTRFVLYYYESTDKTSIIGDVKILKGENGNTFDVIDKKFKTIASDCCSIGYDKEYYINLHQLFGDKIWSILLALNDVACYPLLRSRFENNDIYNTSLLRYEGKDMLEDGLYYASGRNLSDSFRFSYKFEPEYTDEQFDISFNFSPERKNEYLKIYGIIGENGVGKTTLLRKLPVDLCRRKSNKFNGKLPLFSKIIAVSFSPFDIFNELKPLPWFNYVYCGLMSNNNKIMSIEELCNKLKKQFEQINKHSLGNDWKEVMSELFNNDEILAVSTVDEDNMKVNLNDNITTEFLKSLSSGQRYMLLTMTSIIANISPHSLLLIDEPEQHMHPNGVTAIMRSLFSLARQFNSYIIIATHSPLVIRELVSDRVYIMRREHDLLDISKIPIESFGEDVSVLTDRIFGNYDQKKKYINFINDWAKERSATYESIIEKIEINGIHLSLNARMCIREAILKKENE